MAPIVSEQSLVYWSSADSGTGSVNQCTQSQA